MEEIENIEDLKDNENIEELLLNKLNDLQKKVREFLNVKLKVNITGKEIKLDLKNKNIDNIELNLLSCLEFENLEEIDLSHNKISNIKILKDFNMSKLKKLDLSFNKLNDYKNFYKNKKGGNKTHRCKYCEIRSRRDKHNMVNFSKEDNTILSKDFLKLDDNDLLAKDIEEIKNHIINYHQSNNCEKDKNSFLSTEINKETNDNKKDMIISLLSKLEAKVMNFFNVKLKLNLTGNEIKLDLNNKNIGNIELNLLSCVDFKNLEEINLSHNNISDIEPLKDFNSPKLKKLDLSFNKINNISPFKEISKKKNKIEFINISSNSIENVEILKTNIFPLVKEINLDNNNIIGKDIEEIKEIIIKNNNHNNSNSKNLNDKKKYDIETLLLNFMDSKNIKDTSIRKIFMDFIIKIFIMNLDNNMNMFMNNNMNMFLNNNMNMPMNNNMNMFMNNMIMNNNMNMFMNNNMNMYMNMPMNNNMNMYMNMPMNNNMNMYMNMPMNNNMNMFMNNMNIDMNMNMFMNNNMNNNMNMIINNMNLLMNNNNIFENLDNQNTFFEYVYDRFIINDKDNDNNIEKTFIYNNFLNFIDYLKINDTILHSKFINLRNHFIFNINLNNIISNLNVKYDENKKINFIFQTSNGKKITLSTPLDLTFNKLINNFKSKLGSNSNFIFIYNAIKLNIEDKRPVKDIFKFEINKDYIIIMVYDNSLIAA